MKIKKKTNKDKGFSYIRVSLKIAKALKIKKAELDYKSYDDLLNVMLKNTK